MASERRKLSQDFVGMITQSIREEDEAPARRDRPVLGSVSVRIPTKLKRRIDHAAFRKGIEKTQLVRHFFVVAAAVLLEQDDILDSQMTLFDPARERIDHFLRSHRSDPDITRLRYSADVPRSRFDDDWVREDRTIGTFLDRLTGMILSRNQVRRAISPEVRFC